MIVTFNDNKTIKKRNLQLGYLLLCMVENIYARYKTTG